MEPSKIQVVKNWPTLKSAIENRGFIGLARYYRRFMQDFFKIVAPLTKLTRKGEKYVWTEECASAFDELKTS